MDRNLRGATEAGDPNELYKCIRNNADILEDVDKEFVENPLHIAAARGHTDLTMAFMYLKPSLARKLNQDILSPMHLALQNEHDETVLSLFVVDRDLARVKGKDGYTPLHHVVRQGKLDLLAQFLMDCPACVEDVTIKNEIALHIAAQNNRFEAFEILARWIQRTDIYGKVSRKHVLNLRDTDGNTVLHIAATNTQPQMIKLLVQECDVDTKETNMRGLTAFNVLESQSSSDDRKRSLKILRKLDRGPLTTLKAMLMSGNDEPLQKILRWRIRWNERATNSFPYLSAARINALLVVLALILTATYQAMLAPPGVWQGDISGNDTIAKGGATAKDKSSFHTFMTINFTVFLYTSVVTVGLLQFAFSDSEIVIIIVEILLSGLISCLLILADVMVPGLLIKRSANVSDHSYKVILLLSTFAGLTLLEMARWSSYRRTPPRRVKYLKKIFRQL